MRRESFKGAELFLADSREITGLPYHDVVVSDPPFSIPHDFSPSDGPHGKRTLGFGWDSKINATEIVNVFAHFFATADAAFVFCGLRQATPLAEAMAHNHLVDKMACWRKPYPPPPGPGNWWPSAFELAIYGYRHGSWFGDTRPNRHNVFLYDALRAGNGEKNGHPTQKPVALLDRIIGSIVRPNAVVIDPFMGSGTTGVAALRLGRRFVGVEIEERWFDLACRRIEAEARQGHLSLETKAWNGGDREAALASATERTERAIVSGCPRCGRCDGVGALEDEDQILTLCSECGGAGFLVPAAGMPVPIGSSRG